MKKAGVFRKKYPRFIYQGYFHKVTNGDLEVFFDFVLRLGLRSQNYFGEGGSLGRRRISTDIKFRPKIVIKNINKRRLLTIGEKTFNNFIFHLGLMELPSYWKATCSPEIEIRAGYLDKQQIKWWKDFILNGMGQFFYENRINFRSPNFLKIISVGDNRLFSNTARDEVFQSGTEDKFLAPMGEGKDSITTLELLKNLQRSYNKKMDINCFIINPTPNHFKILKTAGIKNPIIAERKIDPVLLKLNRQGYLNGHTPVTAAVSYLAVFCAILFGFGNVVMSCERSADEGNVKYLGKTINHQWSKSFEFEKKFREYLNSYLIRRINYFSLLRPLYEIQIAKIFSQFSKYFPVFLSCNEARKTKSGTKKPSGKWCGKCPKCLFIWTVLYPFAEEKKLVKIFGKNLFEKKELLEIMKELIGEKQTKPLECVGTKKECLVAFYLGWKKAKFAPGRTHGKLPVLLGYFEKKILPKYPEIGQESEKILNS